MIVPYLMMVTPLVCWVVVALAIAATVLAGVGQAEESRALAHGYDRRKGDRRRVARPDPVMSSGRSASFSG